ncbi:hypothetical protein [Kitasatospora indigofera]|uniref:hypothetical protein n=1 Tax=Kitasatospora indigofera TaxID=67307 RepID=UPI00324EB47C
MHARGAWHRVTAIYGRLPGVTVERSADLAVWQPLGGVLGKPGLADLISVPNAGGVRSRGTRLQIWDCYGSGTQPDQVWSLR